MFDPLHEPNFLRSREAHADAPEDSTPLQTTLAKLQPDTLFSLRVGLARLGASGDRAPLQAAGLAFVRDMREAGQTGEEALHTLRRLLLHIPEMKALQHDLRHRQAEKLLWDCCRDAFPPA